MDIIIADIVESNKKQLIKLCQKYQIEKIELFGSGIGKNFDLDRSDLDFLVQFKSMPPKEYAECFLSFKSALEDLFMRPVDLVESNSIRNPYFWESIESNRVLLYAS